MGTYDWNTWIKNRVTKCNFIQARNRKCRCKIQSMFYILGSDILYKDELRHYLWSMKGCLAKQKDLSGFLNPQMCFSFRARSQGAVQVSSAWLGQTLKLNLRQTFPGITFFLFLLEFVLVLVWFGFSRFLVCFPSGHFNSHATGPFLANSGSTHERHVIVPSFGIVQKDFVNELGHEPDPLTCWTYFPFTEVNWVQKVFQCDHRHVPRVDHTGGRPERGECVADLINGFKLPLERVQISVIQSSSRFESLRG